MDTTYTIFLSGIWKKTLVAVSGMAWSLFVLFHMLGNLLIFSGPEIYNKYSHYLIKNPLIYVAEVGLAVFLLLHIVNAVTLFIQNYKAQPFKYAVKPVKAKDITLASKTMIYTGSIMAVFLVQHLAYFKFGTFYAVSYAGEPMRDMYRLVMETFRQPLYVVFYVVSLAFLSVHLYHGFSSSFQTLGFFHPKYTPWIKYFGMFYGIIVGLGFIACPIYILFFIH